MKEIFTSNSSTEIKEASINVLRGAFVGLIEPKRFDEILNDILRENI